ncbi:MAG: NuA4 histone H4 acetyltransferase complex and the SWR1 complex subunit [Pleopsidium flavum]|nr:MAG: NuA4 histone H4 acetyltransferase complex and the SWR1 complex subunit [Pleopsidium flavum]
MASLKMHPYGPDAEGQRERREEIISQNYEEVLLNVPVEAFYNILTSGPPVPTSETGGKGGEEGRGKEVEEVDRLREATKEVDKLMEKEREKLTEKEKEMEVDGKGEK